MEIETRIESVKRDGCSWKLFNAYFPFGDVSLREGSYQRLLEACLRSIENPNEQQKLLNLLDAQGSVFLEQMWSINEMLGTEDTAAHFVSAWLQINDNLRSQFNLDGGGCRRMMMELASDQSLVGKMLGKNQ